ncbi:MAG: FGGY family carbohydrate kinase [Desulfobacterales bacterium]
MAKNLFLGLDLSTQSLTAAVIEPATGDLQRHAISFDSCYPSYQTTGGVIIGDDPGVARVDPRMWIEALDDMLDWLNQKGLSGHLRAIGVSAQQHGTVFLNQRFIKALSRLEPSKTLAVQLHDVFSRNTSPIWMDSSTTNECREITASLGGDLNVARLTGSVATERFAAPQIRKFWKENPAGYRETSHIALISSFVTSLLVACPAPVDAGDGFGTNLADIRAGGWSPAAMTATAPDLERRLPPLVVKDEVVGNVSSYLVSKYKFNPQTLIITGSGDNPCSLVGLGLIGEPRIHAISLGTSDTYFGYTPELKGTQRATGHIFGTADGRYMFLICFKNGSLARERIKDRYGLTWADFSEILMQMSPGNNGRILLPYFLPEITPPVPAPQVLRFGGLAEEDASANVCAVAEAQAMAMYRHSSWAGRGPESILVTAGGSENRGLLKVISRVFGTDVRAFEIKESASLGAAIRAAHCCLNHKGCKISWNELTASYVNRTAAAVIHPSPAEVEIYHHKNGLLHVYAACENFARGMGEPPQAKIEAFRQQFPP